MEKQTQRWIPVAAEGDASVTLDMAESADVPTECAAGDLTVSRRVRAWFEIT